MKVIKAYSTLAEKNGWYFDILDNGTFKVSYYERVKMSTSDFSTAKSFFEKKTNK